MLTINNNKQNFSIHFPLFSDSFELTFDNTTLMSRLIYSPLFSFTPLTKLENFRILTNKLRLKYILDPSEHKSKTIPAPLKTQIWKTFISEDLIKGKCFCCLTQNIEINSFHSGHIISRKEGGKIELENLRPLCSSCNQSMKSKDMYSYIKEYNFWGI